MTRMTGPDCAVMCNLLNKHTHKVHNTNMHLEEKKERTGQKTNKQKDIKKHLETYLYINTHQNRLKKDNEDTEAHLLLGKKQDNPPLP